MVGDLLGQRRGLTPEEKAPLLAASCSGPTRTTSPSVYLKDGDVSSSAVDLRTLAAENEGSLLSAVRADITLTYTRTWSVSNNMLSGCDRRIFIAKIYMHVKAELMCASE